MTVSEKGTVDVDRMYSDPGIFKARALEEIRRARRYPTFVSLVSVDLSHIDPGAEIENFRSFGDFVSSLRSLVRQSIRETDLIGGQDHRRILILLVETPGEGAAALSERLRKTVKYFLVSNIKSPVNWRVPIREYHFPTASEEEPSLLTALDELDK